MMNLSDRQADAAVNLWLHLLKEMQLDGFEAGHALKRLFFSYWLKPANPPSATEFSHARTRARRFVAAVVAHSGPTNADVLILRSGHTDRELLNLEGLASHLAGLNVAMALPASSSFRRVSGITRVLRLQATHGRRVARARERLRRRADLVESVRREFGLPRHFCDWFWLELERAIWRYFSAETVLGRAKPRVLVSAGDNLPGGYPFHVAAKQMGIPSVVIQHGFIGQEWLHYPLRADRICVWGDVERQWYVQRNISPDRVIITGNHRGITNLPVNERNRIRHQLGCAADQRLVVWFTTPHGGQWLERFFSWLEHPAMKGFGGRLILKLHPKESPATYGANVRNGVTVFAASDFSLKSAFVAAEVVVHDHSSIGAEAHFCGQNVICAAVNPPYPSYYRSLIGPQAYVQSPDEMVAVASRLGAPTLTTRRSPCLGFGGEDSDAGVASVVRSMLAGS